MGKSKFSFPAEIVKAVDNYNKNKTIYTKITLNNKRIKKFYSSHIANGKIKELLNREISFKNLPGFGEYVGPNLISFLRHIVIPRYNLYGYKIDARKTRPNNTKLIEKGIISTGSLIASRKRANKAKERESYQPIENRDVGYTNNDEFPEGRLVARRHLVRERNPLLRQKAKEIRLRKAGELRCDVCAFSFKEKYGEIGADFIEVHHIKPISDLRDNEKTSILDVVFVCSNCHSMLHKKRPWLSIDKLKFLVYK